MKEPDLKIRGRASISRSLSPVSNRERESLLLSPSAAKARGLRESRKLSWGGYENLIKPRTGEELVTSPLSNDSASPTNNPRNRHSRFFSPSSSPLHSPLRGPSPDNARGPSPEIDRASTPPPVMSTSRRPSKRQSMQALSSVEISGRFSAPPDLYSFPRSKSHVRFSRSMPKLPDELPNAVYKRSISPVERHESPTLNTNSVTNPPVGPVGTSPVPGFGHGHGRPTFVSHLPERGREGERRAFFGDNYGYGDAAQVQERPIKVTFTPRMPGDEAWRDEDEIKDSRGPFERLDGEGLAFKVPEYLADLRGTSQDGERPVLGPRVSNIAGVQVVGSHRRSTFIRAVEAVTGLGATVLAPSTERITSKYVTTAAKRNSTVIVPVNAKQWLLQSLRMRDWELRELFDQMERIPQLAADHVREVRAEWESLEARALKVPPEADMLLKDQQLLERTKTLLRRFIQVVSEDTADEEPARQRQESPDMSMATSVSEQEGISPLEAQPDFSFPSGQRTGFDASPSPFVQRTEPVSAELYLRKPFIGKPICPTCGRLDVSAPNTRIMGGMLPRESTYQTRGPSPIPRATLPSFIPFDDYVIRRSVVKPSGKSDKFKSTYSPLEKRWYTVLFPALQPGKREDVTLLSEWLCHATQRNGVEDPDGHFKDAETAFVLHSIAFLEVVRQVRIHCEERGDMILHVWRQLLRIFNQVMQRAEPKLTAMEDDVRKIKELRDKDRLAHEQTGNAMATLSEKLKETQEHLHRVEMEIVKYKRCRLCLAGNMTPRTRENFVRKAMLKRFTGADFGTDNREKARATFVQASLTEHLDEVDRDGGNTESMGIGERTYPEGNKMNQASVDDKKDTSLSQIPQLQSPAGGEGEPIQEAQQVENPKPSTVITFLRAALLKRSRRPGLEEAANQQIQSEYDVLVPKATAVPKAEKSVQTDDVTILEPSKYAKVLKRSTSCPARLFWVEIYDPVKSAKHKQWLIDNGMIPDIGDRKGDDDEVEIVVAGTSAEEATPPAGEGGTTGDTQNTDSKMKKHVNRLANETMDVLGTMGEELAALQASGGAEAGAKIAALLKKWKKVARATSLFMARPESDAATEGAGAEDGGDEPFEWDDGGEEGEGDDESGTGRGRRRKRRGKGKKDGDDGEPSLLQSRKSVFDIAADVLKRSKRSTGKYTAGQGFELGKTVPLGFAKMMDISKPPKVIKFFNDRQLTKIITSIYLAKVEADILDDAADGDRQSSCEFVYDFMLNLYGLKRLAESAVWGLFKKINLLRAKKEIEKCHKARIFNRFCGMDETKYYSERDLYLYLKVMSKGIATNGLFYPSELDDGISFVNCVWVDALASEPNLISYLGSQAAGLEFIQKFVANHSTMDKVSLEVKKITKAEKVKRIDFDELMEAIFEKGAIESEVVQIPRRPKKGVPLKAPLSAEQRLALENLFVAGDANQDGVLTFTEFREIILSANPAMSQQNALRMFRETLLLEPEGGDKISPAAFATVAHKHDITAPPSVIFDLLKKTWLQIQADVNKSKVKDEAAKKESDDLRMRVAYMIDTQTDTNGAVQAFKDYVLKFCGEDEGEREEGEEEQEEEEMTQEEPTEGVGVTEEESTEEPSVDKS